MKAPIESAPAEAVTEVAPAPHGGDSHAVPAADAVAVSLVLLLAFCVVCFMWGAAVLGRRERHQVDQNPAKPDDPGKPAGREDAADQKPDRPAWEREADWWKK
jgi:hypothetical protein